MSRKLVIYGGIAVLLTFYALDHVSSKVQSLRTFNVSVPDQNSNALSIQHFYPVFAQGELSMDQDSLSDYQSAFYSAPTPDVNESMVIETQSYVELVYEIPDLGPAPVITPPPEPIDPINFLERNKKHFSLQATMPSQGAAIINGWAYNAGEAFPGKLNVNYIDEHGESQTEALTVHVSRIARGYVELGAESKQGWEQRVRLTM